MVEIFKTNVNTKQDAQMLIDLIQNMFTGYKANFDLEDCDRVFRVKSPALWVESLLIIKLLRRLGFEADILPDENPTAVQIMLFDTKYYPVPE